MPATQIALAAAIAKAKKGSTRGGLVTVESHDVRRATEELGGFIRETWREYVDAMQKLGGERVKNGHRGARYGFAAATMASIIEQHKDD